MINDRFINYWNINYFLVSSTISENVFRENYFERKCIRIYRSVNEREILLKILIGGLFIRFNQFQAFEKYRYGCLYQPCSLRSFAALFFYSYDRETDKFSFIWIEFFFITDKIHSPVRVTLRVNEID